MMIKTINLRSVNSINR